MNIDTLAGEGTNLKGRFKQSVGDALGDRDLQADGAADQVAGNTRKMVGALRDLAPLALVVILGIALFGGLRRGGSR